MEVKSEVETEKNNTTATENGVKQSAPDSADSKTAPAAPDIGGGQQQAKAPAPEVKTGAPPAPVKTDGEKDKTAAPEKKAAPPAPANKPPEVKTPGPGDKPAKADNTVKKPEADKSQKAARAPGPAQKPKAEKGAAAVGGIGGGPGQNAANEEKLRKEQEALLSRLDNKNPPTQKPATEKAAPFDFSIQPTARPDEPEKVVYIKHSELFAPKDHPFGVRDDNEMRALVASVKSIGVTQPALVRPREEGGYELVCGNRRQRANELAGNTELKCIVRNMTDDEAVLAMTDDNLRQRSSILPSEKAASIKMQFEAIKHQGTKAATGHNVPKEEVGKKSIEIVGLRNTMDGKPMTGKQVQRYIWLNNLVPDLKKAMDEGRLTFTPAVEVAFIQPKNQNFIAVALESTQVKPTTEQAQRMRKLDKEGGLTSDVIDGILLEEKSKEVRQVIISGAELEKYFGKTKTPQDMKAQIIKLLDDWAGKEKTINPPEKKKPERE